MAHVRKQIRDAVVAALTGLSSTGTRVYPARNRALGEGHAPALLVYARDEQSDTDSQSVASPPLARLLNPLVVEGRVTGADGEDVEDALDLVAAEVEVAMQADFARRDAGHLGALTHEVTLARTRIDARAEGKHHVGAIMLEFRIGYRTPENAPGTAA